MFYLYLVVLLSFGVGWSSCVAPQRLHHKNREFLTPVTRGTGLDQHRWPSGFT